MARANKISIKLNGDGIPINSKNASITFSEEVLIAAGYPPIRSGLQGDLIMHNHKVSWTDSTGVMRKYKISECWPDETVGLIVAILSEYQ